MTKEELKNLIGSWSANLTFNDEDTQFLEVEVPTEELREISLKLKDDSSAAFDYLFALTGVDYGKDLGVVYHIESTTHNHMIVLKVRTSDRENTNFDSINDIWPAAYFNESEAYDLFGIKFNNHPHLTRIFMDEDWKGWPMRKDYTDEFNMLTR